MLVDADKYLSTSCAWDWWNLVCNKCKENRKLELICKICSVKLLDSVSICRPAVNATVRVRFCMMLQTRRKSLHVYWRNNLRRILSIFNFDYSTSESEIVSSLPLKHYLKIIVLYITFFSIGATTHCGVVFCSPLAGYSFLAYEVTWSHPMTHHSR